MKSPNDLLNRLPSVGDLLENPRIKALVDRAQETDVAQGVRQFVDRMRSELSRRALDAPIPSIGELADRAARFILGRHAQGDSRVINATGQLWYRNLSGPPLADEALAATTTLAQHFHVRNQDRASRLAAKMATAQAGCVVHSASAAIWLALSSLAGGTKAIVARGEVGTLERNVRLTQLASQAGVELVEVGAADSVSLDDYRAALEVGRALVLRMEALPHALDGETCRPDLRSLAGLAAEFDAPLLHHIGRGPLAPLSEAIPIAIASADQSVSAGAAVVICHGDGYLGGPACGIAVGKQDVINQLTSSPLFGVLKASRLIECTLASTLHLLGDPDRAALALPTLAMLSTPLLNLQSRAERLAPQIDSLPGIVAATPIELPAAADMAAMQPLPSFGISVLCNQNELESIKSQLSESTPPIIGVWHGDRVLLDLRTVLPEEDIALVSAFEPPISKTTEAKTE